MTYKEMMELPEDKRNKDWLDGYNSCKQEVIDMLREESRKSKNMTNAVGYMGASSLVWDMNR